ncbi:MAG: DUF4124 domain-containing protein [Stagnimonas sp.]|nr:DUF4124 domain-containing protein [Stagnimonas sp.]
MSRLPWALSLLLALLLATPGQAGDGKTYRWVDDKGRIHYSDVPVPSAEQIQVKPGSGVVGIAREPTASTEQRKQDCEQRKEQLQTYEAAASITETDPLGNVRTYNAAEREQLLNRTREQVAQACTEG